MIRIWQSNDYNISFQCLFIIIYLFINIFHILLCEISFNKLLIIIFIQNFNLIPETFVSQISAGQSRIKFDIIHFKILNFIVSIKIIINNKYDTKF